MLRERRHVVAISTDSVLIQSVRAPLAAAGYVLHSLLRIDTPSVRVFVQSADAYVVDLGCIATYAARQIARVVQFSRCPGLALTGHDRPDQGVIALQAGVSAVLSRPVYAAELVAMLDNLTLSCDTHRPPSALFLAQGIVVDSASSVVACQDSVIALTAQEGLLLRYLAQKANRIIAHPLLCDALGISSDSAGIAALRQLVTRMRRKLRCDSTGSLRLVTERQQGYGLFVHANRSADALPGMGNILGSGPTAVIPNGSVQIGA